MKSRRSVVRAILFMLRLQKSVIASRESRRASSSPQLAIASTSANDFPSHHHYHQHSQHHKNRFLSRAESTRHRRRSSTRQGGQHRNSAPGGAITHRSPSIARFIRPHNHVETALHFGAFSAMSQPYSLGLRDSRGTPLLSVCVGAAHALASTALVCRQQSLDEHLTRSLMSSSGVGAGIAAAGVAAAAPSSSGRSGVFRQGSVETSQQRAEALAATYRKKNAEEGTGLQKKVKTNMISVMSALIAIEQDDNQALQAALRKNLIDADAELSCGVYAGIKPPWTLLEVALLLNSKRCADLLLKNGATERAYHSTWEQLKRAVTALSASIEERKSILKQSTSPKEFDKQVKLLNSQCALLQRMESTLNTPACARIESAKVEATSSHSVVVHPVIAANSQAVAIKYKVEWSTTPCFSKILGSRIVTDLKSSSINVENANEGGQLHFRLYAGTIYNFGAPKLCTPNIVELSSWEEIGEKREGREELLAAITTLTETVEKYRQSLVWQRVFPGGDASLKKRKNGLRELFSASSKFAKNMQSGCYLAALIYSEGRVLCTVDDCLPCFAIDETVSTVNKEDLQWLLKLSLGWDQLTALTEANPTAYINNIALSFRAKVISAATDLMNALGIKDIGRLAQPIVHDNVVFLVTVRFVSDCDSIQALTTHWMTFDKLLRKRISCAALDKLTKETVSLMNFFESSQIPLKRGLYVCYLKLHSSLSSIRVVVPDNMPAILPYVAVRDNPHVTRAEWAWIKTMDANGEGRPTSAQRSFHRQLFTAVTSLLQDLDIDPDLIPSHRMLHAEIIRVNKDVSIILVLPKPEDVCSAPTGSSHHSEIVEQRRGCTPISMTVFETIHLSTYNPPFIYAYCKLAIFIEHFLMIAQYEQRKCLLENDTKVYRSQTEALLDFQKQLDNIWASSRWISRIAAIARDRSAKCTIPLSRLLTPLPDDQADVGYQSDQSGERPCSSSSSMTLRVARPLSLVASGSSGSLADLDRIYSLQRRRSIERLKARTAHSTPLSEVATLPPPPPPPSQSGIVVVYAAYDCGIARGTSVRLSIAATTTSQEIVALVVEQLAKAGARRRGESEAELPCLDDFCLAVVIGARERRLRDDFALLKLQNPWAKGKIFVRRKDAICSAVQVGNEAAV